MKAIGLPWRSCYPHETSDGQRPEPLLATVPPNGQIPPRQWELTIVEPPAEAFADRMLWIRNASKQHMVEGMLWSALPAKQTFVKGRGSSESDLKASFTPTQAVVGQ